MELQRQEYELRKPKNWGEQIYLSMKNRENEPVQSQPLRKLTFQPSVMSALDENNTVFGPLNASKLLDALTEDEQCSFFTQYTKCQILILQSWQILSMNVMRCISITMGESLLELDLSYSYVAQPHLEIILVRASNLKSLKLVKCPFIEQRAAQTIMQLSHSNLKELYVNSTMKFNDDALEWIGGCAGVFTRSLKKLRVIDLGNCNITDRGLAAVANGCKKLQFINLEQCSEITDDSLLKLIQANPKIELVNLYNCNKITNKSAVMIGKCWSELISINLGKCANISDKGMKAISIGCQKLQAVNIAGLVKVSEESMFCLADRCKSLLSLNLTGCERITINGLNNLISGLDHVEKGITFLGFKPVDHHTELKLLGFLSMIHTKEERRIATLKKEKNDRERAEAERIKQKLNHAATIIQQYMFRYKKRMYFYRLWQLRLRKMYIGIIQRVYRGYRGRCKAIKRRIERDTFQRMAPAALRVQTIVRGYLVRLHTIKVARRIQELRMLRRKDIEMISAIRMQCIARRFLANLRFKGFQELQNRRLINLHDAVLVLQMLVRRFLAKNKVFKIHTAARKLKEARLAAGFKVAKFCTDGLIRYRSRLSGEALRRFYRHKWTAASLIQRAYRGFCGRETMRKRKIELATMHYAAREIQRIYRGAMVLHWRDMRLNVIAAYVLDRHYVERRDRVEDARKRYHQFQILNMQDSASEPDDVEPVEYPWIKYHDSKRKRDYWQNYQTNEINYDEPPMPLANELGMINKRIRVYWIVQAAWYEGVITRYHRRKCRHRIEYDDGDHEWINLDQEGERIQMQSDDGSWMMYVMYQNDSKLREGQKIEAKRQQDDFKEQAFRDANQWKPFNDDKTGQVMFMSDFTGELRSGLSNALDWVVQDDGYGFPCFFNIQTGTIVHEDPRFTYDIDDDLLQQRKFVMQELRYALYICKDLWEKYEKALELRDQRQINSMMIKIRNSPKRVHLDGFILRAKGLYRQSSVVDKPLNQMAQEEIDYATWIAARLGEVTDKAEDILRDRTDKKRSFVEKLRKNIGQQVYCRNCKRETKKHLQFCAHCGKEQVLFLYEKPMDRRKSMLQAQQALAEASTRSPSSYTSKHNHNSSFHSTATNSLNEEGPAVNNQSIQEEEVEDEESNL